MSQTVTYNTLAPLKEQQRILTPSYLTPTNPMYRCKYIAVVQMCDIKSLYVMDDSRLAHAPCYYVIAEATYLVT